MSALFHLPQDPNTRRVMARAFGALVALVVVGVIGSFLWIYPPTGSFIRASFTRLGRAVIPQPHIVVMRGARGNVSYTVSGNQLIPASPHSAGTRSAFFIKESAALLSAGVPVLGGPTADGPARTVAVRTDDGRLLVLASSADEKTGIVSRPDGLVAFAAFTAGTTSAPDTWHVWSVRSDGMDEAQDLGNGAVPAFAKNGNILAVSQDGLVEVNPAVAARTVRLGAPYAGAAGPALVAPDASYAVLPNGVTGQEDVFSIDPSRPSVLSFVGSFPQPQALGALSAGTFLAQTDETTATAYTVTRSALSAGATMTIAQ